MELIPEWAPNIHPLLIHFPIAIILLAALINFLNFYLPDHWWDEFKTTLLYIIGAVAAIAAYYSGNLAADSVFLPAEAQSVLNEHAGWALWTVWFFGVYAILRGLLHWYQKMDQQAVRIGLFLLALPGLFLLYETGDHGAKMVFGYGVGTGQLIEQKQVNPSPTDSLQQEDTTFNFSKNDNWTWQIGPNGVGTLLSHFQWLEGSVSALQPTVLNNGNNNYLLEISVDSATNFFVNEETFQNVQVDYYLDLSNFNGEVSLVNHVLDHQNYDFVTLTSNGSITQGRINSGKPEVFAKESYSSTGMLFIRTVSNGTHFRAYINKKMAVHGHGDAPEEGSVGLRINGTGSILIDQISLTQLN